MSAPEPSIPPGAVNVSLADLFRWAGLIEKLVAFFRAVRSSPVGTPVDVPGVEFDVGDERWRLAPTTATRMR